MTNEIAKKPEMLPDQIDGYTDETEDGTVDGQGRPDWIKFDDGVFMLGEVSIDGERRVVLNITRSIVKRDSDWHVVESQPLGENEKIPDVDAKNEATPRDQWITDYNGEPCGPWEVLRTVDLIDMRDMSRQVYSTRTIGGERAVSNLANRIKNMRRFRGVRVFPEVEMSHTLMPIKKGGGRERPHFRIVRWFIPGTDGSLIEVPSDPTKPLPAIAGAPQAHITQVPEPSLGEEMQDKLSY